jgi:hypothetical protein
MHREEVHNSYFSRKYNQNDQIREDAMGRACSTNWIEEDCIKDIGG